MNDASKCSWEHCPLQISITEMQRDIAEIKKLLQANDGIMVRMDRLERSGRKTAWLVRTVVGAVIGGAGYWLWNK